MTWHITLNLIATWCLLCMFGIICERNKDETSIIALFGSLFVIWAIWR